MSEDKNLGILKVAKELNIGLSTIAEFLNGKGFKVEARPTTKLSDEMYSTLLKEYQGDKILREESKSIVIGKIRRDDATIALDSQEALAPIPAQKEEDQKEILIKNTGSSTIEKPVIEKPEPIIEPVKEVVPEADLSSNPGVKIIGKIDLDSLNSKTRPDKKDKKVKEEKPVEAPKQVVEKKVEEPKIEAIVEKVIEPKVEVIIKEEAPTEVVTPIEEKAPPAVVKEEIKEAVVEIKPIQEEVETESEDDDVIRAKAKQLTGPKIIGRIELPVNKKTQPVASSSNPNTADSKRKRKRKPAPGGSSTGTGIGTPRPPQGGSQGGGFQQNRPAGGGAGAPPAHKAGADKGARPPHKRGQALPPKAEPTEKEIQDQIKATLARLSGAGKSGKFAQRSKLRRQKRDDVAATAEERLAAEEMESKVLKTTEFVTANELATMMDVSVTEIIATCMSLGLFVSINQRLDAETLAIVADEFGYEIQFVGAEEEEINLEEADSPEDAKAKVQKALIEGPIDYYKASDSYSNGFEIVEDDVPEEVTD